MHIRGGTAPPRTNCKGLCGLSSGKVELPFSELFPCLEGVEFQLGNVGLGLLIVFVFVHIGSHSLSCHEGTAQVEGGDICIDIVRKERVFVSAGVGKIDLND